MDGTERGLSARRKPSINDVAKKAGVSRQTVSRALNNQTRISESTRRRVLKAAEDLDYHPNTAARTLSMRRSHKLEVSVVVDHPTTETAVSARRMADAAEDRGYSLVFSEMRPDQLRDAITSASARAVEGMIIHAPSIHADHDIRALAAEHGLPIVRRDYAPESSLPYVAIDQVVAMQMLIEHLLAFGHDEIAEISGPNDHVTSSIRHELLRSTLESVGAEPPLSVEGDYSIESGLKGAQRLLDTDRSFTVIVAGNDHMALGVMHGLRLAGLSIPGDVSVTGIDDKPYAAYLNPPLTTVRHEFDIQDSKAVNDLIDLVEGADPEGKQTLLAPELIRRASVRNLRQPA